MLALPWQVQNDQACFRPLRPRPARFLVPYLFHFQNWLQRRILQCYLLAYISCQSNHLEKLLTKRRSNFWMGGLVHHSQLFRRNRRSGSVEECHFHNHVSHDTNIRLSAHRILQDNEQRPFLYLPTLDSERKSICQTFWLALPKAVGCQRIGNLTAPQINMNALARAGISKSTPLPRRQSGFEQAALWQYMSCCALDDVAGR